MIAYVYILQCNDDSLYTGWTYDLLARIQQHNNGLGAKYTRSRLPAKLIYYEQYSDKRIAQQREYAIKQLSRAAKLQLVSSFLPDKCK